jgi:ribosomal protein S25
MYKKERKEIPFIFRVVKTNLVNEMRNDLPKNKWFTYKDIADKYNVNVTNINKYVARLIELGEAEKKRKPRTEIIERPIKFRLIYVTDMKLRDEKLLKSSIGIPMRESDFTLGEEHRTYSEGAYERGNRFFKSKRFIELLRNDKLMYLKRFNIKELEELLKQQKQFKIDLITKNKNAKDTDIRIRYINLALKKEM